jgi:iron(III) transport system substrate-binding protein
MISNPFKSQIDRRSFVGGATAFGTSLGFAGPLSAADEATLAAAAKAEGAVMLYSVIEPAILQALVAAFGRKYGLKGEFQRLGTAALSQRYAAEADSGNIVADVVMLGDRTFLETARGKDWIGPSTLVPANLPAGVTDGTLATVAYNPESLAWNTSLVRERPTSWEALLDPRFAGRVSVFDPRNSILGVKWYSLIRKAYGDDFLRRLSKQATFSASVVPAIQQVAAGAIAMYAPAIHVAVDALKQKGAPIDEAFFEPATTGAIVAAVSKRAPRPAAASLLFHYVLTPEGQAILNKDNFSPLPNVPGARTDLPKMTDVSDADARAELPQILQLLSLS